MHQIATITVREADTAEECIAIVRAQSGSVAIALSRRSDGDIEVILPTAQARELADAMTEAIRVAERAAG